MRERKNRKKKRSAEKKGAEKKKEKVKRMALSSDVQPGNCIDNIEGGPLLFKRLIYNYLSHAGRWLVKVQSGSIGTGAGSVAVLFSVSIAAGDGNFELAGACAIPGSAPIIAPDDRCLRLFQGGSSQQLFPHSDQGRTGDWLGVALDQTHR